MSPLSRKIAAAVDANPGPGTLAVDDGPFRLALHTTAAGPLGVAFDALEFATAGSPGLPDEALRAWGDRLAARLTYLMEPLVVLEADPVGGEVTLRSQAPTLRASERSYYEARLRREGTMDLRRVAFDESDRRRRPVACRLTLEALERLADDLVASLA